MGNFSANDYWFGRSSEAVTADLPEDGVVPVEWLAKEYAKAIAERDRLEVENKMIGDERDSLMAENKRLKYVGDAYESLCESHKRLEATNKRLRAAQSATHVRTETAQKQPTPTDTNVNENAPNGA
jgi:hypothetical protein